MVVSKKILVSAVFAAISLVLIGCGGAAKTGGEAKAGFGNVEQASSVYPKEIEALLAGPYSKSITAVGMATSSDQITALKKAQFAATQQIAAQFEQEVSSLQKNFLREIGEERTEAFQQAQEIFVLTTLYGDRVIKEMSTKGANGFTAYVLRALDAEVLKNMLEAQKSAAALKEATVAWDELEERVAQEKALRALN